MSTSVKYTTGYKYRLYEDARLLLPETFREVGFDAPFASLSGCVLTIFEGYAWDGASGPTVDDKSCVRGALGHDVLYQAMHEDLLPRSFKGPADDFLRDQCVADGMNKIRAWFWHRAVKRFGLTALIRNKNILVAP